LKVAVVIKTSRSTANSLSRFVLVAFGAYNLPITMNSISPDVNLLHIPALLNPRKRWIPSNAPALSSGEVPKNTQEIARYVFPIQLADSLHFSKAKYDFEQLKVHFTTVQRRDAAFTTGAGVDYPEEVTIIPKKS
jgi:hypothetical protein